MAIFESAAAAVARPVPTWTFHLLHQLSFWLDFLLLLSSCEQAHNKKFFPQNFSPFSFQSHARKKFRDNLKILKKNMTCNWQLKKIIRFGNIEKIRIR